MSYYTPVAHPANPYGYQNGSTYWINGYRMYLHGGYWYFVDYPNQPPLQAARNYYRTGGGLGVVAKVFGVIFLITGIGMMFGDGVGFIVAGALFLTLGIFGTALALTDSMRNHPTAWKVGATVAVTSYLLYKATSGDGGDDD